MTDNDKKDEQKADDLLDNFEEIDLDAELDRFIDEANEEGVSLEKEALSESSDTSEDIEHKAGVLAYRGKRYAVGLTWLTVDEDADPNLVKDRTKKLGADFHCLRNTIVTQHGFGYIEKGHKMGMNAAGALAADALIGEWHGVFVAENGWWYLAVHSDTIAPDGDIFFEKEEDAYNYFLESNQSYQWPRSYAPEAWNLPKTSGEIELSKLFEDMPPTSLKPGSLNAIFGGKRNKEIAFVLGGVFVAILFFAVIAQQTLPNLLPEQKQAPSINVAAPDSIFAPPRPVEETPEETSQITDELAVVQPSLLLEECMKAFSRLAHPLPGWRMEQMRCRNGLAEARWRRTSGSLESLRPFLGRFPFGVSKSFSGDNVFLATTILQNLDRYTRPTKLPEREVAILTVNDRFGKISDTTVTDVIPQVRNNAQRGNARRGGRGTANAQPEEERPLTVEQMPHLAVSMRFESPPNLITNYFDIPGFILDMIEWDIGGQRWAYEGRIILKYEKQLVNNAQQQGRR